MFRSGLQVHSGVVRIAIAAVLTAALLLFGIPPVTTETAPPSIGTISGTLTRGDSGAPVGGIVGVCPRR